MNETYKKLIADIRKTASLCSTTVEINNKYDYITVEHSDDDSYIFQGDEKEMLEEEYKNSVVCDDVTMEEYLKYVSQGW